MLHGVLCSPGTELQYVPSSYTESTLAPSLDQNILQVDVLIWQEGAFDVGQHQSEL